MTSHPDYIFIDKDQYHQDNTSSLGNFPNSRLLKDHISHGFIVLDKLAGPTSHDVVATVKKILQIDKAGHSGTLDPQVTGVLLIALDNSTKVLSVYSESDKEYICNFHTTGNIDDEKLISIIKSFSSDIFQVPPLKSNVAKKLRKRKIHRIEILDTRPSELLLRIECQSGTYIRTLCRDIGRAYGFSSHMKELRRTKTAHFLEQDAVTLHQLYDAYWKAKDEGDETAIRRVIQPVESMVHHLPTLVIRNSSVEKVCHGTNIYRTDVTACTSFKAGNTLQLLTAKGELIGIGIALALVDESNNPICHPTRILMPRDAYS